MEPFLVFSAGLMGLLSGLAVKRVRDFRRFQDILIAVAINVGFALLFSAYKYGGFYPYYISRVVIWSSIFLVAAMIIFAGVVRRRQYAEKVDKEVVEGKPIEVKAEVKPSQIKLTETQKAFLLSPVGRSLLGVTGGIILGIISEIIYGITYDSYDFASAYFHFGFEAPTLIVACGLAGLIAYPHKFSVILMITGFFVAAIIITGPHYVPYYGGYGANPFVDIVISGGSFGVPAGALISRILGESNKIGSKS